MYIVIELQLNDSGILGNFVWSYDDINEAFSKYHALLSVAATSDLLCHSAAILDAKGRLIANKSFEHYNEEV